MKALIIILAIILFFVLLLSIRFRIEAEYFDEFCLKIKWLFFQISIFESPDKALPVWSSARSTIPPGQKNQP